MGTLFLLFRLSGVPLFLIVFRLSFLLAIWFFSLLSCALRPAGGHLCPPTPSPLCDMIPNTIALGPLDDPSTALQWSHYGHISSDTFSRSLIKYIKQFVVFT